VTATGSEPVLRLTGVIAGYGRAAPIVRGVDLELDAGTVTTIIGPNGSGKSTLLRCVAGLVPLRAGEIVVRGQSIGARPAEARVGLGMAFCAQGRANFPHLTVEENLRLAGFRLSRRTLRDRLEKARRDVPQVAEHWRMHVGNLSGGQQQSVEIAMALISQPSILLLDEPTLGLSRAAGRSVLALGRRIADDGACVTIVEQNVKGALDVADRLVVLEAGQISLIGDPSAVLADPRLREIYIGSHGATEAVSRQWTESVVSAP
jgi:branched-chain amino acid transport system ATP-binding protein